MTATAAQIGWGGKVFLQDSGGVYQQLSEVTEFPFPDDQIAEIEATHMQSPGRRREYIAGLIDGQSGTIVTNYIPGSPTDVLCRDLVASGAARGLRIQLLQADTTYYQIDATVIGKQYQRSAPIDNRISATLTVRYTGAATETDI